MGRGGAGGKERGQGLVDGEVRAEGDIEGGGLRVVRAPTEGWGRGEMVKGRPGGG